MRRVHSHAGHMSLLQWSQFHPPRRVRVAADGNSVSGAGCDAGHDWPTGDASTARRATCGAEANGLRHELKRAVALNAPLVLRMRHLHKPAAIRPLCCLGFCSWSQRRVTPPVHGGIQLPAGTACAVGRDAWLLGACTRPRAGAKAQCKWISALHIHCKGAHSQQTHNQENQDPMPRTKRNVQASVRWHWSFLGQPVRGDPLDRLSRARRSPKV